MEPSDVLSFWFEQERARWFEKSHAFDGEIRQRFLPLYEEACRGDLERWKEHPRGCLALAIIFDQFPRNMFRGTAEGAAASAMCRRRR